ncbi:hypothetical protein FHS18_001299 [Paenibacillus phyllosphaerae]|uniref:Uncharacterized protein n=1 Tax=Paenibacillus phyllosphaerae TaxID=274593 RepID=A0A7W5AV94_9BACL|nr:hypothetical protein [Paenibacillus phyllosphaerae]MBB3109247.1 hypothetical protein [Paenibacillus phyllosphaerae]
MEKRLTRTELFFSLGFIFMLVVAVGAFFYGAKIGAEQTEAKYVEEKAHLSGAPSEPGSYPQQDLVSFYHTVFLPYREFQSEWYKTMDKLAAASLSEPASALKELASLAKENYKRASSSSMQSSSPLLQQAQVEMLKGIKLLGEAASRASVSSKDLADAELMRALVNDSFYKEGVEQVTASQLDYYKSMLRWSNTVNSKIPATYDPSGVLGIAQWKTLSLTVKNKLMADQLKARQLLTPYYPQDLTTGVDEYILSGEATKMKMKTVDAVVDLLVNAKAIRSGDFMSSKSRLYEKEVLPQLPFFFSEEN